MTYFSLSALINAIVSWLLGFYILSKNSKSPVNRAYFFWCLSVAVWSSFYFLWQISVDAANALLFCRLLMFGAIWVPVTFYHFSTIFLGIEKQEKKIIIFSYILGVIFTLLLFTELMVASVQANVAGFLYWPRPGIAYIFFLFMFVSFTIYPIFLSYKALKKADSIKKQQIKLILVGIIIAIAGGSTNYFLWYDIPIKPYGNILVLAYPLLTAYAIIRYRFADIRFIVKRSAIFTFIVLSITSIYTLLAYLFSLIFTGLIGVQSVILNGISTAILVAIGFEPLKKLLSRWTDSFLFKGSYNPQELLTEITTDISATLDLKKVLNTINQKLFNAFRATLFSIYLYDDEKGCFKEAVSIGNRSQAPRCLTARELLKYQVVLKKYSQFQNLIVTDELKKINETNTSPHLDFIIKDLENNDISVTLPVFLHKKPIGIFFLGPKKSGDYYSREDLNVLEIVAAQSATAIENSSLYKEVNDFNKNLQKKVEEQTKDIVEKNTKLERLLKIKSEFLDIASHQLRTPVSVICGILDMFKSGTMDKLSKEKQMTFISNAFSKGQKLNAVINDILDASDLDEKELELKNSLEDLNFSTLVNNIVSYNQPEAEQKKIKISVDIAKDIMIKGDKKYLEQAVGNLVDNAVKYTQENKELSIKLSRIDKFAQLEIKDSGIGIPEKEQKILFQKFSRASNAKELHTDGSGLGLFIVKKVINAHPGAKIWFESKEGQGTTFFIQLLAI